MAILCECHSKISVYWRKEISETVYYHAGPVGIPYMVVERHVAEVFDVWWVMSQETITFNHCS